MKTKKDLLEIYSAYLPYSLRFRLNNGKSAILKGIEKETQSVWLDHISFNSSIELLKPFLFNMDMLTKEVAIGSNTFIPAVELSRDYFMDCLADGLKVLNDDRANYITISDRTEKHTYQLKRNPERMEWSQIKKLLSWHFNVFNLDLSEYEIIPKKLQYV